MIRPSPPELSGWAVRSKPMAIDLDALVANEIGEHTVVAPEDREERTRDAILRAKLSDRSLISELKKEG